MPECQGIGDMTGEKRVWVVCLELYGEYGSDVMGVFTEHGRAMAYIASKGEMVDAGENEWEVGGDYYSITEVAVDEGM